MNLSTVSSKGQITLPSAMRRKLGIKPETKVEIELQEDAIVVRPLRSISDLRGIFRDHAAKPPLTWEQERALAERALAEEGARE